MTHSIDADPAGDLVLKLGSGDEVTLIRVHSKVLSLASPVFAAMLSPRFAEGHALEDSKAMVDSTTTTIALPDDDPTAMSLLCKTLHYKEDAAQQAFHPPNIHMGMAVICDKYNMSRALSPWSHIWMDTCHREDQFDLFQTAEISYGLAHHESFWKSTRDILRHSKIASLNIEYSLLPDKVIGESPVSITTGVPILLIARPHIQVRSALNARDSSTNSNLDLKPWYHYFSNVVATLKSTKEASSPANTSWYWENTLNASMTVGFGLYRKSRYTVFPRFRLHLTRSRTLKTLQPSSV